MLGYAHVIKRRALQASKSPLIHGQLEELCSICLLCHGTTCGHFPDATEQKVIGFDQSQTVDFSLGKVPQMSVSRPAPCSNSCERKWPTDCYLDSCRAIWILCSVAAS